MSIGRSRNGSIVVARAPVQGRDISIASKLAVVKGLCGIANFWTATRPRESLGRAVRQPGS